jgi:hypothetical protein
VGETCGGIGVENPRAWGIGFANVGDVVAVKRDEETAIVLNGWID